MNAVSVWLLERKPLALSSARSSSWFSMMPLWTSAMRALRSASCGLAAASVASAPEKCGWALCTAGTPCVAQRVCAMPVPDCTWSALTCSCSSATRAALHAVLVHCDAAGVIAAVFEALQALDEDGNDVAGADAGDDATHGELL